MQNNNDNRYLKKDGKTVKKTYVAKKNNRNFEKEKKLFSKPFVFFLILLFLLTVLYSLYIHPFMQISDIYISGNKNISDEQIISQMSNPIGENILIYNVADSEERINAIDTVDGVEIKKVFPNLLSIEVDESYPLFYQEEKDKTYYIDNKAKIVENSQENNDGLIKIRGAKLRNITGENFTSSEASLNFVKAIQEFSYIDKVKEIDLENKAEIGIMLNDIDVKFGDLNNISDKLKLLDKILNDIDQKGVLAVQIDLDNGKNPRVKVDDQSFSEDLNY